VSRKTALLVIAGHLMFSSVGLQWSEALRLHLHSKWLWQLQAPEATKGIFDSGWAGLVRAQEDLGVEARIFEGKEDPALYYERLLSAAKWA